MLAQHLPGSYPYRKYMACLVMNIIQRSSQPMDLCKAECKAECGDPYDHGYCHLDLFLNVVLGL